jgi:TPP-dependent pyruvate/acetoin dehydrogenase alpha subunit
MSVSKEKKIELYRNMVTMRGMTDRLYEWYLTGVAKGNFTDGRGEEAIPVAISAALRDDDYFKPNFRSFMALAFKGYSMSEAIAFKMFDPARGYLGFSLSLGEEAGVYTGAALSAQLRGSGQVAVYAVGEGTASRGPIHEAMVTAAAWDLPIIFVVQNNHYCGGTHWKKVYKMDDLTVRGKSYGMPSVEVDGNDIVATYEAVKTCVDRAREGGGPSFIVANTYRLSPYFERAPGEVVEEIYRPQDEVDEQEKNEPIGRYRRDLEGAGILTAKEMDKMDADVRQSIEEAFLGAADVPAMDFETYCKFAVDTL